MTEQQPSFGKSALKAILLEAIILGCALVFYLIAIAVPVSGNFNFVQFSNILFWIALVLGSGVGIFILVLAVQTGKINVSKILQLDLEKVGGIILYVLIGCGIICVIALITAGAVPADRMWGAWIVGVVGLALTAFTLFFGILTFASKFQEPRAAPPAEKAPS